MKICHIAGARPQFMQAAVLFAELQRRGHRAIIVHTGQHYDDNMSRVFFEQLGIPEPAMNLGIGPGSHGAQTGRILAALDAALDAVQADVIVVDGDTNSTLAGALAAGKRAEHLVHVEAGMRCFDRRIPEEINRIVADHVSDLLCAPTLGAMRNLEREGLGTRAVLTGDLLYDCYLRYSPAMDRSVLEREGLSPGRYLLATIHRAENTREYSRYAGLLAGLSRQPMPVVLPVHPRTRTLLDRYRAEAGGTGALTAIEPVGYLEMLALVSHARCVVTDSGGVQREAFFAGVPSVILRDRTEWVEQVDSGWSTLGGPELSGLEAFCERPPGERGPRAGVNGDGAAAAHIVDALEERLVI